MPAFDNLSGQTQLNVYTLLGLSGKVFKHLGRNCTKSQFTGIFVAMVPYAANIRVFHHIKVIFKKKLLVEYTSKSSSYE